MANLQHMCLCECDHPPQMKTISMGIIISQRIVDLKSGISYNNCMPGEILKLDPSILQGIEKEYEDQVEEAYRIKKATESPKSKPGDSEARLEEMRSEVTKPLKFKLNSEVLMQVADHIVLVTIRKGEAGIYLVRIKGDGTYVVCPEKRLLDISDVGLN